MMAARTTTASPAWVPLRLLRLPGVVGPVLRCSGELSGATAEALRRELALLAPQGTPVVIVNITGCRHIDCPGLQALHQLFDQLGREGCRLLLVAGPGQTEPLTAAGLLPVYASEAAAATAEGGPS